MIVWKLDALMRQRRARGREMAKRMGIGENYLSRVRHEVPDRLSLALLDALCRELDCTIADLLEYRPSAAPPQVAVAELHQEVTPVPRRPRRAPAPRPAAAAPEPEPMPVHTPVPAAVLEAALPPLPEPATPPRERPVLPIMAPLPGSPVPPPAAPPPAPQEAEGEPSASDAAAHYVRLDALQARLDRLKRRK